MMTILPLLLIAKGVVENLLLSFYQRVRLLAKGKSRTDLGGCVKFDTPSRQLVYSSTCIQIIIFVD